MVKGTALRAGNIPLLMFALLAPAAVGGHERISLVVTLQIYGIRPNLQSLELACGHSRITPPWSPRGDYAAPS